jgi:pyrimidine oxygenase
MKAAALWADYNFIMPNAELTTLDLSTRTQTFARQVGRSVRSYALLVVIAEETDAKAEAVLDHINETVDVEAVETWRRLGQADATGSSAQRHRADAFMGVLPIVGSYKTVADRFCELHAQGLGGAAMVFPNWGRDVKKFGENVIPLVDAALLGNDVRLTKKSA